MRVDQDRQGRKTDTRARTPFSSWIADQAMKELTKLPDKLQNATEITSVKGALNTVTQLVFI